MILGHLINPQLCGLSYTEVKKMTFAEATVIIGAVSKSNNEIAKASG